MFLVLSQITSAKVRVRMLSITDPGSSACLFDCLCVKKNLQHSIMLVTCKCIYMDIMNKALNIDEFSQDKGYLSPSIRYLNCRAMILANTGPTSPPLI